MASLESCKALIELDRSGALVPHGLGGHGRECLQWAIWEIERLRGDAGPFICGTVGKADTGGLHDGYVICPQFGSDYVAIFMQKRAKD